MTTPDTVRREAYARIIDSEAWRRMERDRKNFQADPPERFHGYLNVAESLAKADAILAKESEALVEAVARVAALERAFQAAIDDLELDGHHIAAGIVAEAREEADEGLKTERVYERQDHEG